MTSLLIVESPAKCSKIQGYLGPGWRVIATMGHIRALEEDLDAIGLKRDFEPRFAFLKTKSKAITTIKEAAAKASTIYLASDDDREGEAISYSVAVLLKLDPATTPRAVFREITASAVKAAVAAPRRIDMNRVHAQQARAVLDMMVGFTISPLLWKYVGPGLSAGRCQTPALRLLVDREQAIANFKAESSWRVSGKWSSAGGVSSVPALTFEATLQDELEDEESATNFLENIHTSSNGTVKSAVTRPTSEAPPKPLITSTLQQEVSATMGIQPKNTMRIAQRLYEAGHITYMRTDCATLSEEAKAAAQDWVRKAFGDAYVAASAAAAAAPPPAKAKAKGPAAGAPQPQAQEAHEAIRPTHFEAVDLPEQEDWNLSDKKVYRLIRNRAIQSVMTPSKGEQRTIDFTADEDPVPLLWRAQWRRITFPGWRRIGAAATDLDAEGEPGENSTANHPDKDAWAAASQIMEGAKVMWSSLQAAPFETRAPARFTEATLVRELEQKGIGRPSTFAMLVGTILEKEYAEKRDVAAKDVSVKRLSIEGVGQWPPKEVFEKKKVGGEKQKLAPTALGTSVLEFCMKEFDGLFAYDFTALMESRLDKIAEGVEAWKGICRDTWDSYKGKWERLQSGSGAGAAAGGAPSTSRTFAGGIKAVQTKKGPLLLKEGATKADGATFYGWPEGGVAFGAITEEQVAAFVAEKTAAEAGEVLGEHEGAPVVKKKGPYGFYAECEGVKVPWTAEDTETTLAAKFEAKGSAVLHTLGPFEFRKGPYGVYMFKKDLTGKFRKFVGLPSGVDPKSLTQEAAVKLYQNGLQTKAKAKAFGQEKGPQGKGPQGKGPQGPK